jgi:hypothetical protein
VTAQSPKHAGTRLLSLHGPARTTFGAQAPISRGERGGIMLSVAEATGKVFETIATVVPEEDRGKAMVVFATAIREFSSSFMMQDGARMRRPFGRQFWPTLRVSGAISRRRWRGLFRPVPSLSQKLGRGLSFRGPRPSARRRQLSWSGSASAAAVKTSPMRWPIYSRLRKPNLAGCLWNPHAFVHPG